MKYINFMFRESGYGAVPLSEQAEVELAPLEIEVQSGDKESAGGNLGAMPQLPSVAAVGSFSGESGTATSPSDKAGWTGGFGTGSRWLTAHDVSVIANTINALTGVSIFAMPWGYLQSGVVGGSILVFIVAFLSFETARAMLAAQKDLYNKTGNILSFAEIASFTLGPGWAYVVKTATVISCLGGCTGYLIFLGETVGQLFRTSLLPSILFATIPLVLLSWVRSFRELTIFTILGVVAIILAVLAITLDGEMHHQGDLRETPLFMPLSSSLKFLGPATFLFTIHYCVLSMGSETLHHVRIHKPPSAANLSQAEAESTLSTLNAVSASLDKPLIIAYLLSAVLICILGGGGFLFYRNADIVLDATGQPEAGCYDRVCQNVILNLSPGLLTKFVGVFLIISILLSYIILFVPAREHIELYIIRLYGQTPSTASALLINSIRTCLVIFTATVAVWTPYFGSVLGAVGGLTDALQSFVLPPLIFLNLPEEAHASWMLRWLYRGILVWGVCTIGYTIVNITIALMELQ